MPIVGVEAGVFLLCVLAADEAVAAVIEALIGFGCFLGEPPSMADDGTVGPTDCERPTGEEMNELIEFINFDFKKKLKFLNLQKFHAHNARIKNFKLINNNLIKKFHLLPFDIFFGLFCGLPFNGLP